jgi:hypothetical protein
MVHIYANHKSLKYIFTLVEDYHLEVHYHSGKASVVADPLSRKAHYNYLPIVCITGEEFNVRIPPNMGQYNVTLTLMLSREIIAAQANDDGVANIKKR